jgi:hypothetical protein
LGSVVYEVSGSLLSCVPFDVSSSGGGVSRSGPVCIFEFDDGCFVLGGRAQAPQEATAAPVNMVDLWAHLPVLREAWTAIRELEAKRRALVAAIVPGLTQRPSERARVLGQRVSVLTRRYIAEREELERGKVGLAQAREAMVPRRAALAELESGLEARRGLLAARRAEADGLVAHLDILREVLAARRRSMITELAQIFPIEPDPASASASPPPPLPVAAATPSSSSSLAKSPSMLLLAPPTPAPPLLICGALLREDRSSSSLSDDEASAAALGYACVLLSRLARYLDVPLPYLVRCMGSRSLIRDDMTPRGPHVFPLFPRSDKSRHEYGVFLLQKNIECLLHAMQVPSAGFRKTLQNIKAIVEAQMRD